MDYNVNTLRDAGLEARWGKTRNGAPILFAREPGGSTWWAIDASLWARMQEDGIREAFEGATAAGRFFSVPA